MRRNIAHTVHIARLSCGRVVFGPEQQLLRVADTPGFELKSVMLRQQARVCVEDPNQRVRFDIEVGAPCRERFGERCRRSFPGLTLLDKGRDQGEFPVSGGLEAADRAVVQRPVHRVFMEANIQLHVLNVPPCAEQLRPAVGPVVLEHDEGIVCAAHEAGGAGDHLEGIAGFGLAGVMDRHHNHAVAVCDPFEPCHGVVIAGIAALLGTHLPDLLQRVDDDHADHWMCRQKVGQLFLQPVAHDLRMGGQIDGPGLPARDFDEPPLEPVQRILQTEIHDLTLPGRKSPDALTGGYPMRQPQRQPGFPDLGHPRKERQPFGEQPVHHKNGIAELHVHDLVGGDKLQFCDLDGKHPAEEANRFVFRKAKVLHGIIDHISAGTAAGQAGADPGAVVIDPRLSAAAGTDGQRRRIEGNALVFQIVLQMGPEPLTQLCGGFLIQGKPPPSCESPAPWHCAGALPAAPLNTEQSAAERTGACRSENSYSHPRCRTSSGRGRDSVRQRP